MSLPKASSTKSKDAFHSSRGISSFDTASLVLKEIESFLETELADTPQLTASFDSIKRPSKSKRKRGLIRDLTTNKTRKTLNDMVYDPTLGMWVGNSEALKGFAAHPHLITSKARIDKPKVHGQMVYDPISQRWIGNDPDLRAFEKRTVPLIKPGRIAYPQEKNGMTFDPVRMVWVGGYDDMPDFGTSDAGPLKDDGFVVGTEFQLDAMITQQFKQCAERHNTTMNGWWRDEKLRDHLFVIRNMSIMRMVRDVRRVVPMFDEEPSFMDIAVEKESPLKSPREPEADFDDAWEDVGPFDGTVKLKTLRDDESIDDIDAELAKLSKDDKERKFASIGNRSGKLVVDEDWDGDFVDLDKSLRVKVHNYKPIPSFLTPDQTSSTPSIPSNPTTPMTGDFAGTITQLGKGGAPISTKKPFEWLKSDAPHRKSFQNLSVDKKPTKIAWEDDDELGLEIPAGEPLQLKQSGSTNNDSIIEDDEPSDRENDATEEIEVEEEDWDDVALPSILGEPVTKRPPMTQPQPQEMEEWHDFEIPADKLLKPASSGHRQSKPAKAHDDDFDDLDIPEGFQFNRPSTKRR